MSSYKMGDLIPLIIKEAELQGVDPKVASAIFIAENTHDGVLAPEKQVRLDQQGITPSTGQPSGAKGIFQIVGSTLENLKKQGKLDPNVDYNTLEGQIKAGIAAVKDVVSSTGGQDPLAAASMYVDGQAGLAGYSGTGPMPEQTAGYLPKFARAAGISYTKKNIPLDQQAFLGASVDTLKSIVDRNLPVLQAMGLQVDQNTADSKAAVKENLDANVAGIQAAADREKLTLARDQQLQTTFGLGPVQDGRTMEAIAAITGKMAEMKGPIDHLMAINPFANPIAWVRAQMQLQTLVPQYNAMVQNKDTLATQLAERQAAATNAKSLTPALTVEQINQEALAKTKIAAASANADLAKLSADNLSGRFRLMNEELSYGQALTNVSLAQARLMADSVGVKWAQTDKDNKNAQLAQINARRVQWGLPPLLSWEQFKSLPATQQETLINATTQAPTPGVAVRTIMEGDGLGTLRKQSPVMAQLAVDLYNDRKVKQVTDNLIRTKGMKEGEAFEKAVNIRYEEWRKELTNGDMSSVSPDNPYKLRAKLWAGAPGLETNSIAQFVKGPGEKMVELGEKELLQYAIGEISAGKNVDQVTEDFVSFMEQGRKYMFTSAGLQTLGFDSTTGTGKVDYTVSPNVFGFFDRLFGRKTMEKPVNLMDRTQVKNFLVYTKAKQASMQDNTSHRLIGGGNPLDFRPLPDTSKQGTEQR